MSEELQFFGSKSVTFEVLSPMINIQAMKHIRVGTKTTIKFGNSWRGKDALT